MTDSPSRWPQPGGSTPRRTPNSRPAARFGAGQPAASKTPKSGPDPGRVIVISDDSDDDEFPQAPNRLSGQSTMPTPSRSRKATTRAYNRDDDDDSEVEFLADRSKIRETVLIDDSPPPGDAKPLPAPPPRSRSAKRESSPPFQEVKPSAAGPSSSSKPRESPLHNTPVRSLLAKREGSDRDHSATAPAPKRVKPETQAPAIDIAARAPAAAKPAEPKYTRCLTIEALCDVAPTCPAVTAGQQLFFERRRGVATVTIYASGLQVAGKLAQPTAMELARHLASPTFHFEIYALEPVHTGSGGIDPATLSLSGTMAATPQIRVGIDIKCQTGTERAWFLALKHGFPDTRNLAFEGLPTSAADRASQLRNVATATPAAPPQPIDWLERSTAPSHLPKTEAEPSLGSGGMYSGTTTIPGSFAAGMDGAPDFWDDWMGERLNAMHTDPDDDDDDDGHGGHDGAVTGEQDEVMRGLAGSNYQGRNALSALYDESHSLDVAMLPPFPDHESLLAGRLKTPLKHHQSQGLAWMVEKEHPQPPRRHADGLVMLWRARRIKNGSSRYSHAVRPGEWQRNPPALPRGGILSDDMGLGKTLMIIALSLYDPTGQKVVAAEVKKKDKQERAWLKKREAALKKKGKAKAKAEAAEAEVSGSETETEAEAGDGVPEAIIDPLDPMYSKTTLVVCPLSVIYNWSSQIQEHTRNVKVAIYHGDGIKKMIHSRWDSYDFIITTYDTIKSEFKPIDTIRKARALAETRQDQIAELERKLTLVNAPGAAYIDKEQCRRDLERIRAQQRDELAAWAAKREAPSSSKLKAAFARAEAKSSARGGAKGKSKGKGKGKGKARAQQLDDDDESDFAWSPSATDDDEDDDDGFARPKKAPRKSDLASTSRASTSTSTPSKGSIKSKQTLADGDDVEYDFDELFAYELPKVLKTKYRRLVLDEAHVGRNSKTLLYRAILEITAERVWAVTGTPLINTTKDLQSLCAFLRVEHLEDPKLWNKYIDRAIRSDSSQAGSRLLRSIILCTTLRRTKHMMDIHGKPIVELPAIQMYKHAIELDPETRVFYDRVAEIMRGRVLGLWRAGELAAQYSNVLLFLCRLRQICCSRDLVPDNLLEEMQELLAPPEEGEGGEQAAPAIELDAKTVKSLQEKLRALITTGSEECPICLEAFNDPRITPCSHVFCLACITAVITTQGKCPLDRALLPAGTPLVAMPTEEQVLALTEDEGDEDVKPGRSKEPSPLISEVGTDGTPAAADGEAVQSAKIDQLVEILRTTDRTTMVKGQPMIKSLVFSNFVSFLDKVAERLTREGIPFCRFVGSMNKVQRAQVLDRFSKPVYPGQQDHSPPAGDPGAGRGPGRAFAAAVAKPRTLLEMLDQQFVRPKKEEAVEQDELPDETCKASSSSRQLAALDVNGGKRGCGRRHANTDNCDGRVPVVMLISIQAGAVGLNLTAASQVFLLDPWWQGQIEAQAIDRVHRIGQRRDVKVFQFVCTNTVEERVMEIQGEKEDLIRNSFAGIKNRGESIDNPAKKKESTIRDILRIFGITGRNGEVLEDRAGGGDSGTETEIEPEVGPSRVLAVSRTGNSATLASRTGSSTAANANPTAGPSGTRVKGEAVDLLSGDRAGPRQSQSGSSSNASNRPANVKSE
ncbi:uncharacterized protein PSFLO_06249 [Pseudozyma flocculosa]|uniref:Uncharacterized protein n=1 Tax=Pseudozyma flocculosa TaxID=84751 RepID=A0A5C3FAP2_9BASI|nr:uncharacterized protein PSFLO_06249 [Pseudozyma flocculosa]